MTITDKYLNKRVRCVDMNAPIFFKRKGRVVRVKEPKYDQPVTFHVKFEGGNQVYGDFREADLELIDERVDNPEDKRDQVDRFMEEYADDMDCWAEEAMLAFNIAASDKSKDAAQYRKIKSK